MKKMAVQTLKTKKTKPRPRKMTKMRVRRMVKEAKKVKVVQSRWIEVQELSMYHRTSHPGFHPTLLRKRSM